MRLRNKKTGEVVELEPLEIFNANGNLNLGDARYSSIKDFVADWEDAPEEPKGYWFIDVGTYEVDWCEENEDTKADKEIGNYFSSQEEAEKAVERLRAWQRIKEDLVSLHWQDEKDGKFSVWGQFNGNMLANDAILNIHRKDLDVLFPGDKE